MSTNLGCRQTGGAVLCAGRGDDLVEERLVETEHRENEVDLRRTEEHLAVVPDEVEARLDEPVDEVIEQADVLLGEVLWQDVLDVGVEKRPPAELVRLEIDHAAAADSGRRCLLQVGGLKNEVHAVRHLDDLTAHQAQLERTMSPVNNFVYCRDVQIIL